MGPKQFCWIVFDKEKKDFKIVSLMHDSFDECMELKDGIRNSHPGARMFEGIWG